MAPPPQMVRPKEPPVGGLCVHGLSTAPVEKPWMSPAPRSLPMSPRRNTGKGSRCKGDVCLAPYSVAPTQNKIKVLKEDGRERSLPGCRVQPAPAGLASSAWLTPGHFTATEQPLPQQILCLPHRGLDILWWRTLGTFYDLLYFSSTGSPEALPIYTGCFIWKVMTACNPEWKGQYGKGQLHLVVRMGHREFSFAGLWNNVEIFIFLCYTCLMVFRYFLGSQNHSKLLLVNNNK